MVKRIVFVSGLMASTALASQMFGTPGIDGRDALNGQDGRSGKSVNITADGSAQTFNLSGENGGNSARGGHGGNGGSVGIQINTLSEMKNLGSIVIVNPGGRAGASNSQPGRGAPGCTCQESFWNVEMCSWRLYYMLNGTRYDAYNNQTLPCSPNPNHYGRIPPPVPFDPSSGKVYTWELTYVSSSSFQCTNGQHGSNGSSAYSASNGRYGDVTLFVGSGKASDLSSFKSPLGHRMNKTFALAGYIFESRTGLQSLLGNGSDVRDSYTFGQYSRQKVQFNWKPRKSPEELNAATLEISAKLSGTIQSPKVELGMPLKLSHTIAVQGDTTVVTIKHVLNSTDPTKIAQCAKHNAKGSYLCEYSERCIYEDGDCLPR